MRVQDIMTAKPIVVHSSHRVTDALRLMAEHGFSHLPVLGDSDHLVGIITLADCRVGLQLIEIEDNIPESDLRVREIMSYAPTVAIPTEEVFVAATRMYENNLNALPVMIDETLVGILTISDLMVACIHMAHQHMGFAGLAYSE